MTKIISPCRGCTSRNEQCHAGCDAYARYKINLAVAKNAAIHSVEAEYAGYKRIVAKRFELIRKKAKE